MTETKTNDPIEINLTMLIEYAREGRREVLPLLRRVLDERPSLWENQGNIAYQAQGKWVELVAGEDLLFRESLARYTAKLRADLAGPDATPLEQLHIERLVALNLQLGYYECLLAKHELSGSDKVVDYLNQRCEVLDRRLQQALVGLARIRKLLPGVIRVDVIVSGEVQATINDSDGSAKEAPIGNAPTRITVPKNRVKDLLAAAAN